MQWMQHDDSNWRTDIEHLHYYISRCQDNSEVYWTVWYWSTYHDLSESYYVTHDAQTQPNTDWNMCRFRELQHAQQSAHQHLQRMLEQRQ